MVNGGRFIIRTALAPVFRSLRLLRRRSKVAVQLSETARHFVLSSDITLRAAPPEFIANPCGKRGFLLRIPAGNGGYRYEQAWLTVFGALPAKQAAAS